MKKLRAFFQHTGHFWLAGMCLAAVLLSALWTRDEQRLESREAPAHADQAQKLSSVTPSPAPVVFARPADGDVQRAYSDTPAYFPAFHCYALHKGTDFYAEKGDKVYAAFDGTVSVKGKDVWLQGDSFRLRYRGISPGSREGQAVKKGTVLGEALGYVPYEGGDILCITLYRNEEPVDIVSFLP